LGWDGRWARRLQREGKRRDTAAAGEIFGDAARLMEIAQLPGLDWRGAARKLAWKHHEGLANVDAKTPITSESVFPAASLSKQSVAYLALGLVDEGKLAMDKPLRRVREGRCANGAAGRKNHGAARVEPFERIAELEMGTGRNSCPR